MSEVEDAAEEGNLLEAFAAGTAVRCPSFFTSTRALMC